MLLNGDPPRAGVLIVVDSEGQDPGYVERHIHMHFRGGRIPTLDRVRVAVAEPRHEARLCIALGIDRGTCKGWGPRLLSCVAAGSGFMRSASQRYAGVLRRLFHGSLGQGISTC